MQSQVALVTGTSSGIGLSTAIVLARHGLKVIATMRDTSKADALLKRAAAEGVSVDLRRLDVQDDGSVSSCIERAIKDYGRIDVLVNNAGAGTVGSVEQVSLRNAQWTMDVNFFGVWRCTQAVLPHMRAARAGRIISVSSIGGLMGHPFNDAYCAAKFAVEGMMESLAPVARRLGIHVSLIEPGPVNTEFVGTVMNRSERPATIDEYESMYKTYMGGSRQVFATHGQTGDDIAAVILDAATNKTPHFRYLTSDMVRSIAARKYVDTTGDSIVDAASARLG